MRRRWFVVAMTLWALLLVAGWVWFFLKRASLRELAPDDTRDSPKPPSAYRLDTPRSAVVVHSRM